MSREVAQEELLKQMLYMIHAHAKFIYIDRPEEYMAELQSVSKTCAEKGLGSEVPDMIKQWLDEAMQKS
ncbi:hypothetical protein [Vreelandella alkaliphila]|uniref:hypothetical protein n=1 Tax=Vreelandella alkaliphila TaxID=272774 RepID=UPI003FD74F50